MSTTTQTSDTSTTSKNFQPDTSTTENYDVVIAGGGLSGLTSAFYLKKLRPELKIVVLERSGTAGGLTGNWIDHRYGPDKKLQMPMHMIFRGKYPNLVHMVEEMEGEFSPLYPGFTIITSNEKRHALEMKDWTSRLLPPPLHGLGMFLKLKMSLRAKWDFLKLAAVSTYCANHIVSGSKKPLAVPNTMSLESLEILLNVGKETRDFVESVTPSIYNLHPWYTSAPRMAGVLAGTMTLGKNSLHYHVFSKNYNSAYVDRFVDRLKAMGVDFKFWAEVRKINSPDGKSVDSIEYRQNGPKNENSTRYVCDGCGAENYYTDRAFCTRCGKDTTLDRIREGKITKPVASELWGDSENSGYDKINCKYLITAMYPHMISKLIPVDSPLRKDPYVRSFFSSRGNQTQLSVARVYYKQQVTEKEQIITGTHNPTYSFNGCQSVLNNFGAKDLGYHANGDVIDVLLDVGVIQNSHSQEEQKERILKDLHRVYPKADPKLVDHISYATINPDTLYLSEQPAIVDQHRFFSTHRTGTNNWYVAGCHSGKIGIGMESATQSGMAAVNCLFEDMGVKERTEIKNYEITAGNKLLSLFGRFILFWKTRGRSINRMSGSRYSN